MGHRLQTRRTPRRIQSRRHFSSPGGPEPAAPIAFRVVSPGWPRRLAPFMWSVLKEFLQFARHEKKWWLIPLGLLLVLLGALILFTSTSGIAWALYPFM